MRTRLRGRGFTLVELLVVIAIIGIWVALLLPAIQAAREAARRTQCNNNLKNIGLGLQNYHDTYKVFPMGAIHGGPRGAARIGPSWWYGIMPFMEQRNIYDQIASTQRSGGPTPNAFIAFDINNNLNGAPLNRLVPDFMRCPSSPTDVMAAQTGSVCLPTYVGIAGGTDITLTGSPDTTLYPNQQFGIPTSSQRYVNRNAATLTTGGTTNAVITNSGMLPVAEHTNMAKCSDGTSNTMIVGEQSDWLSDVDQAVSSKYHGDPGWGGPGGTGAPAPSTDLAGGFISGTTRVGRIPEGLYSATTLTIPILFNVTTVRYKPDLKRVISGASASAPGCAEIGGHNNPLQSAHPGGILCAFVDGSVQSVSGTTDLGILLRISIRDDGQNVKLD
jgi:prepilin-type N-terminal cleavage/methylation domain-containing protein